LVEVGFLFGAEGEHDRSSWHGCAAAVAEGAVGDLRAERCGRAASCLDPLVELGNLGSIEQAEQSGSGVGVAEQVVGPAVPVDTDPPLGVRHWLAAGHYVAAGGVLECAEHFEAGTASQLDVVEVCGVDEAIEQRGEGVAEVLARVAAGGDEVVEWGWQVEGHAGWSVVLSMVNSRTRFIERRQLPSVGVPIEPDDLLSAAEVAELLGLGSNRAVSVYRRRYDDFPGPVVVKGKCTLWLRGDVEAWRSGR
jgi:predicted DNA-binding transcriptional regulator AlpA